jgi:hypothetical protein
LETAQIPTAMVRHEGSKEDELFKNILPMKNGTTTTL